MRKNLRQAIADMQLTTTYRFRIRNPKQEHNIPCLRSCTATTGRFSMNTMQLTTRFQFQALIF